MKKFLIGVASGLIITVVGGIFLFQYQQANQRPIEVSIPELTAYLLDLRENEPEILNSALEEAGLAIASTLSDGYLVDVVPAYQSNSYDEYSSFSMGGINRFSISSIEYTDGCVWRVYYNSPSYSLYNLQGQYSTISGILGHVDGSNAGNAVMKIYFDGTLAQTLQLNAGMMPQELILDVSGVNQLKIELSSVTIFDSPYYGLGDLVIA